MDKLQCEQNCIHCPVCGHKEQFKEYFKQHIALRKESVLFESQPTCKFYINENDVERKHTHRFTTLGDDLSKQDKSKTTLDITTVPLSKLKTKLHNSKVEDECTVTKDDYYDGRIQLSSKELDGLIKELFPEIKIYKIYKI